MKWSTPMEYTYGIFVYEHAAGSDFITPLDIFNISNRMVQKGRVVTIAQQPGIVECSAGLKVQADYTLETAPALDVLLVPGAEAPVESLAKKEALFQWIRYQAERVKFLTAVCTGALIFQGAGVLTGKKATTHWMFIEQLSKDSRIKVLPDMRYVRDGNIVTSQGVTAGIDMALWLVGQLHSPEHARTVKKFIHYNPAPPYAAEV
jgi:transcriptional regulator GlxA family with amidase domain